MNIVVKIPIALLSICGVFAASGIDYAGPLGTPIYDSTIKAAVSLPRDFFARQLPLIAERREKWLDEAERCKPKLKTRVVKPVALVRPKADDKAFLGWRFEPVGEAKSVYRKPLKVGDVFYFDFGEHLTGNFAFKLGRFERYVDAPPRLRFVFGEIPAETLEEVPGTKKMSGSWHQDETVTVDLVPSVTELPRRLAFRYVKMTVEASSPYSDFCLEDIEMRATTSADEARLLPYTGSADDAALDAVAARTLRECMQTVLEDGPKRDRRLWLGDLRLQALVNYRTYRNYDVVKRSMLLLSGTCGTNGLVSTAVYEVPRPESCHSKILDFTAMYPSLVLEYLEASSDRATCESLWPIVLKQADFTMEGVDADGLVAPSLPWWLFVDWQPAMTRQAAEQAIIVYSLRATERLGKALGHDADVAFIPDVVARMSDAAHRKLWDERRGVWVSDKNNVSWLSQAWMALSGISTPEEARRSLTAVMSDTSAVRPVTPYAHHYFTEAMFESGLKDEALKHVREYWGGMVKMGADTYWEAWVPDDLRKSPYDNVLLNSYCHAFSCTAGYFLRKYVAAPLEVPNGKIDRIAVTNGVTMVYYVLSPEVSSYIRGVVALPPKDKWNGRLKGHGSGGAGAYLDDRNPLESAMDGWAAVYTDLGSSRGIYTPAQIRDYGHRATHLACVTAKALIRQMYGRDPHHSYFKGASSGGGQGLHEAQRYPEDYDGIISMIPANTRMPLHVYFAWNDRLMYDDAGNRLFKDDELRAVETAGIDVFRDCDEPWARGKCLTDPSYNPETEKAIIARAIEIATSLNKPELLRRLHLMFTGPVINGKQVHCGVPFGTSLLMAAGNQWMLRWYLPKDRPLYSVTDDELTEWMRTWGPDCNARNPDISAFAARGGKLLTWAGLADPICPYPELVNWYESVVKKMGKEATDDCCRLYLFPGLKHEVRGPIPSEQIIIDWVERGIRPEIVESSLRDGTKFIAKPYKK